MDPGEAILRAPLGIAGAKHGRDESELVREAQRGSRDAVEALVRRHWHDAHRAAFLIVRDAAAAEDIAQESVLAAIRAIEQFDSRRPIGPWLHRIVANRSIDWLRCRDRAAAATAIHGGEAPDRASPAAPLRGAMNAALAGLDDRDRAIVVMRHLMGLSSEEIGETLSMPAATVRTRLRRALETLRDVLGKESPDEL